MTLRPRLVRSSAASLGFVLCAALALGSPQKDAKDSKDSKDKDDKRPKITLKAQPVVSISPSKVTLRAELTGGANDYEEFYCPTVEWDWGDGTQSESTSDCEPYEAGKSEIKRRFTVEHVFRAGSHQIAFRLKRRDKAIAMATTTIQVQGERRRVRTIARSDSAHLERHLEKRAILQFEAASRRHVVSSGLTIRYQ